jgi:hypothetical protein
MSESTADTIPTADAPKIGEAWGDDISEERQRDLDAFLTVWDAETDHGDRKGPFDFGPGRSVNLTGADVFYLAARALVGTTLRRIAAPAPDEQIIDLAAARAALCAEDPGAVELSRGC